LPLQEGERLVRGAPHGGHDDPLRLTDLVTAFEGLPQVRHIELVQLPLHVKFVVVFVLPTFGVGGVYAVALSELGGVTLVGLQRGGEQPCDLGTQVVKLTVHVFVIADCATMINARCGRHAPVDTVRGRRFALRGSGGPARS
jgi:hypothetical protein